MAIQSLRVLFRRYSRNKLTSFLNIAGLSIGVAVSLVIFIIIKNELSIDAYHQKRDRIYRVLSSETYRDGKLEWDGDVPPALGVALEQEFPQVEKVATLWNVWGEQFQLPGNEDKRFRSNGVQYVEPAFFDIFDYPWLAGDPHTGLSEPNTMALSRTIANSWFGTWQNATGKTVLMGLNKTPYKVTGVIEDAPANTDIQLKIVCSYITFKNDNLDAFTDPRAWDNFNTSSQCFFLLKKDHTIQSMNNMLHGFVQKHYAPLAAASNTYDSSFFQPLKEMHFDDRFYHFVANGLSTAELWTIGLIGAFILAMACINFVNLATAQSLNRGKEVGIRKVLGSMPSALIKEFMIETGVLVLMALLTGTVVAIVGWKYITGILEKEIPLMSFTNVGAIGFLLALGVIATILAGFYPALIISKFRPIVALKTKATSADKGQVLLRRGLIVFQFIIAQSLIIGTIVAAKQMNFFYSRPMGFDKEAISVVGIPWSVDREVKAEQFKRDILDIPGVEIASLCNNPPSVENSGSTYFTFEGHSQPENLKIAFRYADSNYLSTFGLQLAGGRYPNPFDSIREVVINETTVRRLGFAMPEKVIGKRMQWSSGDMYEIVGVVKDFHDASLKSEILPLAMFATKRSFYNLGVRIRPNALLTTMPAIKRAFENRFPEHFFEANFLDETIAKYYHSEVTVLTLLKLFAFLGIFISCLGLYGLVSFITFQKTKEVGIRRVLGASTQSIAYLFSSEFVFLIGISFLIAAPVSFYFMKQWLQGFHYHTSIGWSTFAIAFLLSILIAWATISYKTIRAAIANPVKSLRAE